MKSIRNISLFLLALAFISSCKKEEMLTPDTSANSGSGLPSELKKKKHPFVIETDSVYVDNSDPSDNVGSVNAPKGNGSPTVKTNSGSTGPSSVNVNNGGSGSGDDKGDAASKETGTNTKGQH